MKKSILITIIILLILTGCIKKTSTLESNTCTYFIYGSDVNITYYSTAEVFINEEGLI